MSGKRYANVNVLTESSSDEEELDYHNEDNISNYKNSDESNGKYDYDDDDDNYENNYNNKIIIKKSNNTSSSSFDIMTTSIKRGRRSSNSSSRSNKRPCMNKNAQAARENRIRKKKHLENVENKLSYYKEKNKSLVNVIQKQDIDIKKLKGEVTYLRCILKNNTNITALLKSMNDGLINNKSLKNNNKSFNFNKGKLNLEKRKISVEEKRERISKKFTEFDHTYVSKIDKTENENDNEEKREDVIEKFRNDNILMDENLATSQLSMSDLQGINLNILDTEIEEEWSRLNVNDYDNLNFTNFNHDVLNAGENNDDDNDNILNKLTNLYDDNNILEEFRDAGICLHVNSDKVSLEFCSICHMNSLNSITE